MQTVELVLVRLIQLIHMLFYTFVVMVYVGAVVLIPLAVLTAVINVLTHGIGFNGIFATIVAVPAVAWVCLTVYRIPGLISSIIDTGWTLIKMGADNFKKFEAIGRALKGVSDTPSTDNA